VVHAELGMDEISPVGMTQVWEVRSNSVTTWQLHPRDYDMAWDRVEDLAGSDPATNAARIESLLGGSAVSRLGGSAATERLSGARERYPGARKSFRARRLGESIQQAFLCSSARGFGAAFLNKYG